MMVMMVMIIMVIMVSLMIGCWCLGGIFVTIVMSVVHGGRWWMRRKERVGCILHSRVYYELSC